MPYRHLGPLCVGLLLVCVPAGCGPGNPLGREAVSGRITFGGEPLKQGNISFEPVDNPNGIRTGAVIADGDYSIPAEKGLPPGKYLVRINAGSASAAGAGPTPDGEIPAPGAELPSTELIPAEYNAKSDISHEVTGGGESRFDLDIPAR